MYPRHHLPVTRSRRDAVCGACVRRLRQGARHPASDLRRLRCRRFCKPRDGAHIAATCVVDQRCDASCSCCRWFSSSYSSSFYNCCCSCCYLLPRHLLRRGQQYHLCSQSATHNILHNPL
jgi:hypothetical protein